MKGAPDHECEHGTKAAPEIIRRPNFAGVVVYQPASTNWRASIARRSSGSNLSTSADSAGSLRNGSRALSSSSCSLRTLLDGSSEKAKKKD